MTKQNPTFRRATRVLIKCLGLAFAYWLTGWLALRLAIPPGYATTIWPAAGVALVGLLVLGHRYWPGIVIGSFCVNVGTSFDPTSITNILSSLVLPVGIGSGAALQAIVGSALIRRHIGYPCPMMTDRTIIIFILMSGLLACLVSPTVGVLVLTLAGINPWSNFLFSWSTWWVGDVLGVLLVTPFLFIHHTPAGVLRLHRWLVVAVPTVVALIGAVVFFVVASRQEQADVERNFRSGMSSYVNDCRQKLDQSMDALHAAGSYCLANDEVDATAFYRFVDGYQNRLPWLKELSWVGDDQAVVRLSNGDPVAGDVLRRSRETGTVAMSGRIVIQHQSTSTYGVFCCLPVSEQSVSGESGEIVKGYVTAIIDLSAMMTSVCGDLHREQVRLDVYDVGRKGRGSLLYTSSASPDLQTREGRWEWKTSIGVADHHWWLVFRPTLEYVSANRPWQAWAALLISLLYATLLEAFLLLVTGRMVKVEELVRQRTAELSHSRSALETEVLERRRLQVAVDERNRELEMLLNVASHDLKEPLRTIESYSDMITQRHAAELGGKGQDAFGRIVRAVQHLRAQLDSILTLAQARRIHAPETLVDGGGIARDALHLLEERIRSLNALVTVAPTFPCMRVQSMWATFALFNLVANALKFVRDGETATVEIGPYEDGVSCGFVVRDRGPGVAPADAERIFELFTRAVGREVEGTGSGLAIVREVARRHGGRAWVRAREGGGSEFYVTFARDVPVA